MLPEMRNKLVQPLLVLLGMILIPVLLVMLLVRLLMLGHSAACPGPPFAVGSTAANAAYSNAGNDAPSTVYGDAARNDPGIACVGGAA